MRAFRDLVVFLSYTAFVVASFYMMYWLVRVGYWPWALCIIGAIGIIAFEDDLPHWTDRWLTVGDGTRRGKLFDAVVWGLWITIVTVGASSVVFDAIY